MLRETFRLSHDKRAGQDISYLLRYSDAEICETEATGRNVPSGRPGDVSAALTACSLLGRGCSD